MTSKSILMAGASALVFSGALFATALADDYDATPVRYDNQAEQTRALNNESLEQARAQRDGDAAQSDGDSDDGPAVVPTDDRDPQDDQDDDDDAPVSPKDGYNSN
jgi:hypothetical protein